jgi:hypothetical protein
LLILTKNELFGQFKMRRFSGKCPENLAFFEYFTDKAICNVIMFSCLGFSRQHPWTSRKNGKAQLFRKVFNQVPPRRQYSADASRHSTYLRNRGYPIEIAALLRRRHNYPQLQTHACGRAYQAPMSTSGRSLPQSPAHLSSLTSSSFRSYLNEVQSVACGRLLTRSVQLAYGQTGCEGTRVARIIVDAGRVTATAPADIGA